MIISLPRTTAKARLFEKVATVDPQYDMIDVGLQYEDGSIDSIAVGGSFTSLKRWYVDFDAKRDSDVKAVEIQEQIDADEYAVTADLPFVNLNGTEVPTEEQRKVATTV